MGDWTVYDGDEQVQAGLTEQAARDLVDWRRSHDETTVYALGPDDTRYPPQ
jgi:hypothetical protein